MKQITKRLPLTTRLPIPSTLRTSSTLTPTPPSRRPPPSTWDTHIHVVPPPSTFPLAPTATYTPTHTAPISAALALAQTTSAPNQVFTQVSIYGNDNSAQMAAAAAVNEAGGKGRVVVGLDVADESITGEVLRRWHAQGVRGVRMNLKSVGSKLNGDDFVAKARAIVEKIAGLHWALQLHIDLALVPLLRPLLALAAESSTKIVLDHFAGLPRPFTTSTSLESLPGWTDLLSLLAAHENLFVKVSAPYRIVAEGDARYDALEVPFRQLAEVRGGRGVMYASDWPHTRFEERADVGCWVERCLEWCDGDEGLEKRIFVENAERVWD